MKKRNSGDSKLSKRIRKWLYLIALGYCLFVVLQLLIIPVRIAIATHQSPEPQAIFALGGGTGREEFTAQFALEHPSLDIWFSAGRYPEGPEIFREAGIPKKRVNFDWYATDTISNFVFLLKNKNFKRHNIKHLYLITSDSHMRRASIIATLILGSRGITFTPVEIPTGEPPQSGLAIARDTCRSVVWVATGFTGSSIAKIIKR